MATKKITLFRQENLYGAEVRDGDKITSWKELSKQEQEDLLGAMASMYELFYRCLKEE